MGCVRLEQQSRALVHHAVCLASYGCLQGCIISAPPVPILGLRGAPEQGPMHQLSIVHQMAAVGGSMPRLCSQHMDQVYVKP